MPTIEIDKKHTIRITFKPHEGLLTDFEVYSCDVPALIEALKRASKRAAEAVDER